MRRFSQLAPVLVPLLLEVLQHCGSDLQSTPRDLDSLELFAGRAEISHAVARKGLQAVAYDKSYSNTDINDLTSVDGFKRAVALTLRVKEHGTLFAAPVCSSWVWIGRSGSGRSSASAAGDRSNPRIRHANQMVVHLVFVLLLAWVRGVQLYVENPVSSLINFFSPFKELVDTVLLHKATVHLGSYGAESQKSVTIWSTSPLVHRLKVPKVPSLVKLASRTSSGVTGKGKELKVSQAYPRRFGEVVAKLVQENLRAASSEDLMEGPCGNPVPKRPLASPTATCGPVAFVS